MPVLGRVIIVRQVSLAEAMPMMPIPTNDPNGGERQRGVDANGDARAVQRTAEPDNLGAPHRGGAVAQQEMRRPYHRRGGEQPQAFVCFRQSFRVAIMILQSNSSNRSIAFALFNRSAPFKPCSTYSDCSSQPRATFSFPATNSWMLGLLPLRVNSVVLSLR